MTIHASPALNNLLFVLVGERLMQADEDMAYASHRPYQQLGKRVRELSDLIEQTVVGVGRALPPQVGNNYVRAMNLFVDNGGTNYLKEFGDQLDQIADGRVQTSMNITESKWQIIAELIRLLIELAIILALSIFSGGSSAGDAAVAKARSRVVVLTVLDQLLKRTHLMPSLSEALEEAFTTFAVRLAMMAFGPDGRRPKGFDWTQIAEDGAFGAFAGLFHGLFSNVTKNFGKTFKNIFKDSNFDSSIKKDITKDITSKIPRDSSPFTTKNIVHHTGEGISGFLVEGGSEAAAEFLGSGLFNGKWSTSWDTFLGAGISGRVEETLGDGAGSFGKWLGNNFNFKAIPNLDLPTGNGGQAGDGGTVGSVGSGTGGADLTTGDPGTVSGTGFTGPVIVPSAVNAPAVNAPAVNASSVHTPATVRGGTGTSNGTNDRSVTAQDTGTAQPGTVERGPGDRSTASTSSPSAVPRTTSGTTLPETHSSGTTQRNTNPLNEPANDSAAAPDGVLPATTTTVPTTGGGASSGTPAPTVSQGTAPHSTPVGPPDTQATPDGRAAPDNRPVPAVTGVPMSQTAPGTNATPTVTPAQTPATWSAARAQANPVERWHTWVDPVSTPDAADGTGKTQYVVRSGFDVRRFAHDGDPVTDLTVEVDFTNAAGTSDAARQALWDRMTSGVEQVFNAPGHRLPGGDRLHVTVTPVAPGSKPHLKVELTDPASGRPMSHHVWRLDGSETDLAHEIGHQLGLRDEAKSQAAQQRPGAPGSLMGEYGEPVPDEIRQIRTSSQDDPSLAYHGPELAQGADGGYTQGGLRHRHLALLHALVGDVDPGATARDTAVPVAVPEPRRPNADPGPVPGADPPAPQPPPVSSYVRNYGAQHDGNTGLVQVEPIPAAVVDGLHRQIMAQLGIGPAAAGNHPVLAQLRDKLSAEQLAMKLPYLRSSMGHRITVEIDGRERSIDVRLALRDPVKSPRYGEHNVTDPDVRVERRGLGTQESSDSESSGNVRTVPVPWTGSFPVTAVGPVKAVDAGLSLSLTHNQYSTSTTVTHVTQSVTAQRSNEPSQPFEFASQWQVRLDSPRLAPPVTWSPERYHGPVTVWFPRHLAADDSTRPTARPADLDDLPVWGVDTVAEPQRLLEEVLQQFSGDLGNLGGTSREELESFLSEPVLSGTLPMQRGGGIYSPVLLDAGGKAIGMFKLTTEVELGTPTHQSVDSKINLESHLVQSVKVDGQAKVTSGIGLDGNLGPSFTGDHSHGHPDATSVIAGSLTGKGGLKWQTGDGFSNGSAANVMHAVRTNRSHLLTPARVTHRVTLIRPAGGETAHGFGPWDNGMALRVLSREDARGHVPDPTDGVRELPGELENLDSLGLTTTPLGVTGTDELFQRAEQWLRRQGFLPPGRPTRRGLVDEALVQAQLMNLRRFEQARSSLGLRAGVDSMLDGGHALWLDRPGAVLGNRRVQLRMSAFRDPAPAALSRHTRTLPHIQGMGFAASGMSGTEQKGSAYGFSLGLGGGPAGPPQGGELSLGGTGDYTYSRQIAHNATVGANVGHDQFYIGSGQGSEVFEVPARFALDLYEGPGDAPSVRFADPGPGPGGRARNDEEAGPAPTTVGGHITLSVPHSRTVAPGTGTSNRTGPGAARPGYRIRPLDTSGTATDDLARLNLADVEDNPLPGLVRLPDDAIIDVFRGSGPLMEAIQQIVTNTYPGHPARGMAGTLQDRAAPYVPGPVGSAANWVGRQLAGHGADDQSTVANEVLRAGASPGNLIARGHQIFKGGYVMEGVTLPGLGADQDLSVELVGYLHDPEHLHTQKQYLETSIGSTDTASQQKTVSGSHSAAVAASLQKNNKPKADTNTGLGTAAPGVTTPPTQNISTRDTSAGQAADTTVTTDATATTATTKPPARPGAAFRQGYTAKTDTSGTITSSTTTSRTPTESGTQHRVRTGATILVTVRQGTRNVVGNALGLGSGQAITVAVELPRSMQFLMTDGQLTRDEKWFEGLTDIPPAADPTLPLPDRFARTREPGLASVLSAKQLGDPDPVTQRRAQQRDRLRAELTALVEREAPGSTQPGHASYLPGVMARIADYTSPAGLRGLPGRGPGGVQRFHFRYLAKGGARLIEVNLRAAPQQDTAGLRTLRGRNAGAGTGMEQFHAHVPAATASSKADTTQYSTTVTPTARHTRSAVDERTDRSAPQLSLNSTRTHTAKITSSAEDRFWMRTDSAADFDIHYDYTASVRSELVADWPPNLVGGLLQGGVLAWSPEDGDDRSSWFDRMLAGRPTRTATVPVAVTLRFTGSDAPDPARPVEPTRPARVALAPGDTAHTGVIGQRLIPTGPAPVFDFNGYQQLAEALNTVAPRLAGGYRTLDASESAESTAVRIGELIQAGDISLDQPRATGGMTNTMPGAWPLESAPETPPTLEIALHSPRKITEGGDVTLDRLRIFSTTASSSVSSGTAAGLVFQGAYSADDPNRNLVGVGIPVLMQQPVTQGPGATTSGTRREWLKTGTTALPPEPARGTRSYEAMVDTVITVRGPAGAQRVTGSAVTRLTERDVLGYGITDARTDPQVYDLQSMLAGQRDADQRDWTRHPLTDLPRTLAEGIDRRDAAAQLWLAIGPDADRSLLGRALSTASMTASVSGKPIELVLRTDDGLQHWSFRPDGTLSGTGARTGPAWNNLAGQITTLNNAARAQATARQRERDLGPDRQTAQTRITTADERLTAAGTNHAEAQDTRGAADRKVTDAQRTLDETDGDRKRWEATANEVAKAPDDLRRKISHGEQEERKATVEVRKADAVVRHIDRTREAAAAAAPAVPGGNQPGPASDEATARKAEEARQRAQDARDRLGTVKRELAEHRRALADTETRLTAAREAARIASDQLPGLRQKLAEAASEAEQAAKELAEAARTFTNATEARRTAQVQLDTVERDIREALDAQTTQADAQRAALQQLPALAGTLDAVRRENGNEMLNVPTGSLASTPARWPSTDIPPAPPIVPAARTAPPATVTTLPGGTPPADPPPADPPPADPPPAGTSGQDQRQQDNNEAETSDSASVIGLAEARDVYGMPEKNLSKFMEIGRAKKLRIMVRPTNPSAPRWLERGSLPKPASVKAKTINELDVHLGAKPEDVGLVGYFDPREPDMSTVPEADRSAVTDRLNQRRREFAALAPDMAALAAKPHPADRYSVEDGLVYGYDEAGGRKTITGDHDIFDISTPGGSRLSPTRYDSVVDEMVKGDMGVKHGAHMYWEPRTKNNAAIFADIVKRHQTAEPLLEFGPDGSRPRRTWATDIAGRLLPSQRKAMEPPQDGTPPRDPPKAGLPKAGPAKADAPKADQPKADQPKTVPAKTVPAKTDLPKTDPPKASPTTSQGTAQTQSEQRFPAARGLPVRTVANGECLLYAFLAGDPGLVRDRLPELAAADFATHNWLGAPDRVRADLRHLEDEYSNSSVLPDHHAAEIARSALRGLVSEYLNREAANGRLPREIIGQLRRSTALSFSHTVAAMERPRLLELLAWHGIDRVTVPQTFDEVDLRIRYHDSPRPAGAEGVDTAAPRAMLAHLQEQNRLPRLEELTDEQLRRLLAGARTDSTAQLTGAELDTLRNAVGTWEGSWGGDYGEAFLPLLAHAFGVGIDVAQANADRSGYEVRTTMGPQDAARRVEVHYNGRNHYSASDAAPAQPDEAPRPGEDIPGGARLPHGQDGVTVAELTSVGVTVTPGQAAEAMLQGGTLPVAAAGLTDLQRLRLVLLRTPGSREAVDAVASAVAREIGLDIVISGPGNETRRFGTGSEPALRLYFDGTAYSASALPEVSVLPEPEP